MASGGDHYSASPPIIKNDFRPILLHWHASIAKNTAAEFAISEELAKGSHLREILLCNLDGDNIMLRTFPICAMEKAGGRTTFFEN